MRLRNAERVISSVRAHAGISRADLARQTELSPATVSSIVDDLIKSGYLLETGAKSSVLGRRPIGLEFNAESGYVIGIYLECKYIKLILANLDGQAKQHQEAELSADADASEAAELCLKLAKAACKANVIALQSVGSMAMAVPGPLKVDGPQLSGMRRPEFFSSIQSILKRKLGISVELDSLVNMAALAESVNGAAEKKELLLYVRVAHALRSAILVKQKLLVGKNNLAGELGHIRIPQSNCVCYCGKTGCANTIASYPSFIEHCSRQGIAIEKSADFAELVAHGNEKFLKLVEDCASAIGFSVAAAINILAPNAVIISSPYNDCGAAFQTPLTHALSKYTQSELLTQCKIATGPLLGSSEAQGAALLAIQNYPLSEKISELL